MGVCLTALTEESMTAMVPRESMVMEGIVMSGDVLECFGCGIFGAGDASLAAGFEEHFILEHTV